MFLDKGNRTLGQVFDVMGVVTSPIYCVRFNKTEDILAKGVKVGDIVYVAPSTEHTNFIVLSDLMKQKGCDASWEDDVEPPPDHEQDFSNDEDEIEARRNARHKKRPQGRTTSEASEVDTQAKASRNHPPQHQQRFNRNQHQRRGGPPQQQSAHRGGAGGRHLQRFYKDNRDYAAMPSNNYYGPAPQHFQATPYGHSWHTAGTMHQQLPPPLPMPPPHGQMYPNPFAHPSFQQQAVTAMAGGFLNPQAFPPLPPPLTDVPPPHNQPNQRHPRKFPNRKNNNRF